MADALLLVDMMILKLCGSRSGLNSGTIMVIQATGTSVQIGMEMVSIMVGAGMLVELYLKNIHL
jgi:hypothetical protein